MKRISMNVVVGLLLCSSLFAMDESCFTDHKKEDACSLESFDVKVHPRSDWSSIDGREDVSKHDRKVDKILVGHTVTDLGDSVMTLQAIQKAHMKSKGEGGFGFSDIAYNFVIDKKGEVYECRGTDCAPSILVGQNLGSCGVGCIGAYHEDAVSDEMAVAWGKAFGVIALRYGFEKLTREALGFGRIVGQSELNSERYPLSPGKNFLEKFDRIVEVANQTIKHHLGK